MVVFLIIALIQVIMTEDQLIYKIIQHPHAVQFEEVIDVIEANYDYHPTLFSNGESKNIVINRPGENEGSCKIFAFAQIHKLSEEQTLHCFGKYYREDVLKHPTSGNHANIRQFMVTGWSGISFRSNALGTKKANGEL